MKKSICGSIITVSLTQAPRFITAYIHNDISRGHISEGKRCHIGQNTYGRRLKYHQHYVAAWVSHRKRQATAQHRTILFIVPFRAERGKNVNEGRNGLYVDVELTSSEYLIGNIQKAGAEKPAIASPVEIHILEKSCSCECQGGRLV